MKSRLSIAPYESISACRICGQEDLSSVIDLGNDFYVSCFPASPNESMGTAPLTLVRCTNCTLVQLKHTVSRDWLYREYWYQSGTNESMVLNLVDILETALSWVMPGFNDVVVDIGANDGTLLGDWRDVTPSPLRAAFEPAENLQGVLRENAMPHYSVCDYFPPQTQEGKDILDSVKGRTAVITSVAMFYDLPDPNGFVQAIHDTLKQDGVWVLELSYLPTMLAEVAFDAICHEHLEYYSLSSLDYLFDAHQMRVVHAELNSVNGGSIRLVVVRKDSPHKPSTTMERTSLKYLRREEARSLNRPFVYQAFTQNCETVRDKTVELIQAELDQGGIVDVYGASTKGNTLLQYFGLDHTYCRWAIERARGKWGKYTVGTAIPIVGEEPARSSPASMWLVPIWHFREAVIDREQEFLRGGGKMLFPLPDVEVVVS